MSKKVRERVTLVIVLLVAVAYGWLSLEWSYLELFGGMAGILLVIAVVGMPWIESAPDGAFRRSARR
jgi:hypothetical protein